MDKDRKKPAVDPAEKQSRRGVQLSFDKVAESDQSFLSFFAEVRKISSQSITLRNEGGTAVYFEWKKKSPEIPFNFEKEDHADYFFIHSVV